MRHCDACCREFTGRGGDCPHCGFNNVSKGGPRSIRSLAAIERRRLEQENLEQELSELSDEFAAWLGWPEAAEELERDPA